MSDLIQRVQARRLRTDPGDELLFMNAKTGHGPPVPPRLMEPPRTANPSEIRHVYPAAPRERQTWPFVVAAVLAGAIGIAGVMYGKRVFDRDDTVAAVVAPPAVAPVAPPPPVTAPPASLPTADSTQLASATPPVEQTVPVAEPTRETASKSPSPSTHRRVKSKRVAKQAVKNRRPASTPAKQSARTPPPRRVESPSPAAKQRQSADDENPL